MLIGKNPVLLFLACVLGFSVHAGAEEVQVAVASNFLNTLKDIGERYTWDTGNTMTLISGSTGKLYAQVRHGAPFDIFLAADAKRPVMLEKEGLGVSGTRFTYAIGALVLWSPDPEGVKGKETLTRIAKGKLALANPKTAPYGRAAQETLEKLRLWKKLKPFLVRGENIAQTLQFVATGNAGFGFVAKSQLEDLRMNLKGSRWEIPAEMHDPIQQQAILLKPGLAKPSAKEFLNFLQGSASKEVMQSYGYRIFEAK